jgi:cytochrome P450
MLWYLRRIVDPITNAGGDRSQLPRLANRLAQKLDFTDGPVDLVPYCQLLIAYVTTRDMGVPLADWPIINDWTADAGLITNPSTDAQLGRAWGKIYAYCDDLVREKRRRPDDSMTSRLVGALAEARVNHEHAVHVISTNFTGYPTPLAVLVVVLMVLICKPGLAQRFRLGGRPQRLRVLGEVLRLRANFATGKPRQLAVPLDLGGGLVLDPGEPLIPSVWAALVTGHGWRLSFGAGDHACPFFTDSVNWLLVALEAILLVHPCIQLAKYPEFPPGLLAVPPELWVRQPGNQADQPVEIPGILPVVRSLYPS